MRRSRLSPWDMPFQTAVLRSFEELGGVITDNDQKASYFVGGIQSIEAVFVGITFRSASERELSLARDRADLFQL